MEICFVIVGYSLPLHSAIELEQLYRVPVNDNNQYVYYT